MRVLEDTRDVVCPSRAADQIMCDWKHQGTQYYTCLYKAFVQAWQQLCHRLYF